MSLLGQGRFHSHQCLGHDFDGIFVDPGGHHARHVGALIVDLVQDVAGRTQQMQPPDAPVPRIRTPLDHAARLQPVDQTGDRDRLDFQNFGQFLLGNARLAVQPDQDGPLRPRHAVQSRALVRVNAEQTSDIV